MNLHPLNQDAHPRQHSISGDEIAARFAVWNIVRQVREAGGDAVEQKAAELTVRYGYQMSLGDVAETFHLTRSALRGTLNSRERARKAPWAGRLLAGRHKLGRHAYFSTWAVADAIVNGDVPLSKLLGGKR